MKMKSVLAIISLVLILAACANNTTEQKEEPNSGSSEEQPYIAIISKGFQHQFWQAVQSGAEKAAEEFQVEITFEGPESESQVDKQMEMLRTALDKKT